VVDCLEVYCKAGSPGTLRQKYKNAMKVFLETGGIMKVRSSICLARSQCEDPDDFTKATVSDFGCTFCFAVADDKAQLNEKVKMVKALDHLRLAEEKSHGKPGAVGEFFGQLAKRSYCNTGNPGCDWITGLSVENIQEWVEQPLPADHRWLNHKLDCIPDKNAALALICATQLQRIVVRPPAKEGEDNYGIVIKIYQSSSRVWVTMGNQGQTGLITPNSTEANQVQSLPKHLHDIRPFPISATCSNPFKTSPKS